MSADWNTRASFGGGGGPPLFEPAPLRAAKPNANVINIDATTATAGPQTPLWRSSVSARFGSSMPFVRFVISFSGLLTRCASVSFVRLAHSTVLVLACGPGIREIVPPFRQRVVNARARIYIRFTAVVARTS
jgi:hypothetical protein